MRRLFGCPDIVSLTEKFLMARNFYRIFTENNPVMGDSKTFGIPEAKGLKTTRTIPIPHTHRKEYTHTNPGTANRHKYQLTILARRQSMQNKLDTSNNKPANLWKAVGKMLLLKPLSKFSSFC